MYEPRTYRHWVADQDLTSFQVIVKETDLFISATQALTEEARAAVSRYRHDLESYIDTHPGFVDSLEPIDMDADAPLVVREMADAALKTGVGPMAAVAGAIAERVGRDLLLLSEEIIVENGGDIFLSTNRERLVGLYAGPSPLTRRLAFVISPEDTPLGICTSSGIVGHSLSFGEADAVVALSRSTALADAAATAIGNRVRSADDLEAATEFAQSIEGLSGVAIVKGEHLGLWGGIRLAELG
jgi:hypothetical protein